MKNQLLNIVQIVILHIMKTQIIIIVHNVVRNWKIEVSVGKLPN